MVAESVGLGARSALETVFPADWQVTVDGTPAHFVEQLESVHVRGRMASSPDVFGDYAVVAGGHNYPFWDPARFDRSIDSIIATLREAGVKHIFWVTLREVKPEYISPGAWQQVQPYYWYFPTVNEHLRAALARHPDLTLIDWAAIADRPGLTYDAIHLNTFGAAEYAGLVARTVQATATRLSAGTVQSIPVAGVNGVPADAAAVALNLTVTGTRNGGYLSAYPCGGVRPEVSNLNYRRDHTVAAAAIVPVGEGGSVCVYTSDAAQLIVDMTGWLPTGAGFARAGPARLADTRGGSKQQAGVPLTVPVASAAGVAAGATAVVLNVTATEPVADGYVTAYPCGSPLPPTSNLNVRAGEVAPNVVVVPVDASGAACVVSSVDAHLLVDLFGSFDASAGLSGSATRAFDSRTAPLARPVHGGETVTVPVGPSGGALLNVTATAATDAGYLTVFPCDAAQPGSSSLNFAPGRDIANFAAVRPSADGTVCVYASSTTHVLVDQIGQLGSSFTGISPVRLFDTRT